MSWSGEASQGEPLLDGAQERGRREPQGLWGLLGAGRAETCRKRQVKDNGILEDDAGDCVPQEGQERVASGSHTGGRADGAAWGSPSSL